MWTSIRTWNSMPRSAPHWVEHEVVCDCLATVRTRDRIQHQLGFDRGGDVVVVVWVAREIQLSGEQFVAGRGYLYVQVRRTPRVPTGSGDELAARTVGRDLVGGRPDRGDREFAVGTGREAATQVPFRDAGGEL